MKPALVLLFILFISIVHSQCPNRNFLWHRIIFLRDSSSVDSEKQLQELLSYEKKIDQCSYKNDSTHALLLQRIGGLYTSKIDFFNAIQYTLKSIAIVSRYKNTRSINPSHAIKSYWNLQVSYDSLHLEDKQSSALDSCISIALSLKTGYDYALPALVLKTNELLEQSDYYRCIYYAKLGESLVLENYSMISDAEYYQTQFFNYKINALRILNKSDEALKLLNEEIKIAEAHKNINSLASAYGLYGSVLNGEGKPSEAIIFFKKSFRYNRKIRYNPGCAEALNNIGFTYWNVLHQNKTADSYYLQALRFADANESLNILDNIANIYAGDLKFDSAFIFFQKSFDQLRPESSEADLLKNNNEALSGKITEYIAGMVLDKAATWFSKYKITGSKDALQKAIGIYQIIDLYFDELKSSQSEIQSKLFWKTNNRRLYEQAIAACYAAHDADKAFYFFEKNRSVLLNDEITQQKNMIDADAAKQAQVKKNILEIERSLQNKSLSFKQNLLLQKQLFNFKQELGKLTNAGSQQSYTKNYLDTSSLTLDLFKKKILNDKKSLVEIFNGDSEIYVLAITANNISFVKPDKHLYDSLTTKYISLITNPELLNKNFSDFINVSHALYKLIFQNIKLNAAGSLLISPDGKSFPFEALVVNDGPSPDYLVNHYATSYTYSAKYLTNQFVINTNSYSKMLGIAPVEYKNYQNLGMLSGSDNSLKIINKYFSNATNYILNNATKNNFLTNFPAYNIIQLYAHAADSSSNNDPVIYFADSALYLSDLIPNSKPVTQLVVLSACETANGKLYQGEGIFSFNRAFAALGIPAAVSNLWSVDNESTYSITELFYKYLSQGLPTDVALQKAKIEFINNSSKEKQLPYFWAGSILTGKVDTIKSQTAFPWIIMIVVISVVLTIIYFAIKIPMKKRELL